MKTTQNTTSAQSATATDNKQIAEAVETWRKKAAIIEADLVAGEGIEAEDWRNQCRQLDNSRNTLSQVFKVVKAFCDETERANIAGYYCHYNLQAIDGLTLSGVLAYLRERLPNRFDANGRLCKAVNIAYLADLNTAYNMAVSIEDKERETKTADLLKARNKANETSQTALSTLMKAKKAAAKKADDETAKALAEAEKAYNEAEKAEKTAAKKLSDALANFTPSPETAAKVREAKAAISEASAAFAELLKDLKYEPKTASNGFIIGCNIPIVRWTASGFGSLVLKASKQK